MLIAIAWSLVVISETTERTIVIQRKKERKFKQIRTWESSPLAAQTPRDTFGAIARGGAASASSISGSYSFSRVPARPLLLRESLVSVASESSSSYNNRAPCLVLESSVWCGLVWINNNVEKTTNPEDIPVVSRRRSEMLSPTGVCSNFLLFRFCCGLGSVVCRCGITCVSFCPLVERVANSVLLPCFRMSSFAVLHSPAESGKLNLVLNFACFRLKL